MKILIIGGSGVISEYLTAIASQNNMDVYCYCRGNRKELIPDNVNIIYGDCFVKEEMNAKLKKYYFDVVIDFLSFDRNQLNIKLEALKGNVEQYIFISSAVIYTESSDLIRKNEISDKDNRIWEYSIGKIECEEFLEEFCYKHGIHYTIARPYITYGNQRMPFQINSFKNSFSIINRIMLGKEIVIAGDGNNQCTITHAEDLCRALMGLFLNSAAYDNDFNITSDENFTWNQVLDLIGKEVGIMPVPIYLPVDFVEENSMLLKGSITGDKARNQLFDNSKLKSVLDDKNLFRIKFEDGLRDTYNHMKNRSEFYTADSLWDREMDQLIEKYLEELESPISNKYKKEKTEKTENSDLEIYRHNYLPLESKYYDLVQNFNWLDKLTSLDNSLGIFEDYFQSRNIKHIAIYGIGNFGKKFYKIIKGSSKIAVKYIIDINIKEYEDVKICNLNDALDTVDIVVVTPITHFNEIKTQLSKKCGYKIISVEEILK